MRKKLLVISLTLLTIFFLSTIGSVGENEDLDFMELVKEGSPAEIKEALDSGTDIEQKSEFMKNTPLIEAAYHNDNKEVISLLLDYGAEIDEENDLGRTALMKAVQTKEDTEFIEFLIDNGADINKEDDGGATPLLWAVARNENEEIIKLLIESGANVNKTTEFGRNVLSYAAENNPNTEIIKLLLNKGANPNNRDRDKSYNPIMWAVSHNPNPEVLNVLIDQGLDIKDKTNRGETLLMVAAANNTSPEIVKFIINKGLEVKEEDRWGWTTLMHALAENENSKEIVEILIDYGAEVERTTGEIGSQRNILGFAAQHNNVPEVIEYLIQNIDENNLEAEINKQDSSGRTPLITAAYYNNEDIIPVLLEYGADDSIEDYDGYTAEDYLEEEDEEKESEEDSEFDIDMEI